MSLIILIGIYHLLNFFNCDENNTVKSECFKHSSLITYIYIILNIKVLYIYIYYIIDIIFLFIYIIIYYIK